MLRGNGIDEHASAVLAFPGGGIGMLDCSFRLPWIEAVFEIRGTEATLRAPHAFNPRLSASSFTVTSPGGRAKQFDVPPCDAFATMFASFNQAVLGRQPYPFLARESLNTARTLDLLAKLPTVPTAEQLG
jgi:predicted dehydrogenase